VIVIHAGVIHGLAVLALEQPATTTRETTASDVVSTFTITTSNISDGGEQKREKKKEEDGSVVLIIVGVVVGFLVVLLCVFVLVMVLLMLKKKKRGGGRKSKGGGEGQSELKSARKRHGKKPAPPRSPRRLSGNPNSNSSMASTKGDESVKNIYSAINFEGQETYMQIEKGSATTSNYSEFGSTPTSGIVSSDYAVAVVGSESISSGYQPITLSAPHNYEDVNVRAEGAEEQEYNVGNLEL